MNTIKIKTKKIGLNYPSLIIAEVAQNHDGSLGLAHAFIDAVAETGADIIKFQTHIAKAESTPNEPFRKNFSYQDVSRYEYWKRMEFTKEQWQELADHAYKKGLIFMSSAFSIEAVNLLNKIGVPAWKIGSGELSFFPLLSKIIKTKKPLILSTGLSTLEEITATVEFLKKHKAPFALLQCTTTYPCSAENIGLNLINKFKEQYQVPVGLSDHSGTIYPSLAAATLGANILEVHVTISKKMFGPDVCASITIDELSELVKGVRFIERMIKKPLDKNKFAKDNENLRKIFFKSIVAKKDLKAQAMIKKSDLTIKKPGNGIPSNKLNYVIGKKLIRSIKSGEIILASDIEGNK